MIDTTINKTKTKTIADTPDSLLGESGITLAELLVYLALVSVVMLGFYQTYVFFLKTGNRSINASLAILNSSQSIPKLSAAVALTEIPIQIMGQAQPSGAPSGSDQGNCLQLAKTILGFQNKYSVTVQWDPTSKLFGIFLLNNNDCSTLPTSTNSTALSPYVYTQSNTGLPFFTGLSSPGTSTTGVNNANIASSTTGFYEVNFNYGTKYGTGSLSNGLTTASTRLSAPLIALPLCRVASPDPSWFTNFGSNLIKSATVQITQNFDSNYDRLTYLTPTNNSNQIIATNFQSIGVLHLFAPQGLSVSNWLSTLSNVIWQRASGAPAFGTQDAPKQFTFTLGEGLTFSPWGPPINTNGPAVHYYLAIKLNNNLSSSDANNYAKSFCYPSFTTDSFLGQSAVSGTSCDTGTYPRLTGYMPTILTQGQNVFIKNTLFNMVYPQTAPSSGAFASSTSPSTGQAWLGGWYGPEYFNQTQGAGNYYWITGYELFFDSSGTNAFANSAKTANSIPGGSAGFYYVNFASTASSATSKSYLYFDIASGTWSNNLPNSSFGYALVEFGNNLNAGGGSNVTDETTLNSTLKLSQNVSQVPYSFFQSCQMTYSPN